MASMKRPRLTAVQALPDYRLRLGFVSGHTFVLDCTPLIEASPGLAPLREPAAFVTATIWPGEGWAVVWPDLDIQIGADTVWMDLKQAQAEDDNRREFV